MAAFVQELETYDSLNFIKAVQELKRMISKRFMTILRESPDFQQSISYLRDIYLLFRDDFFSLLCEELQDLMEHPPNKFSEDKINKKILQNVLMRLGNNQEDLFDKLKFVLKAKGFTYKNFENTFNLRLCGNIEQNFANLRLKTTKQNKLIQSSVWNLVKQNLQQGFELSLSFRFKKNSNIKQEVSSIKICFQDSYDVRSSKKSFNLTSSEMISSAFFVEIGFSQSSSMNFCKVSFSNESLAKEHLITQLELTKQNLKDQDIAYIKLKYFNNKLAMQISNNEVTSQTDYSFELPVELSSYIQMTK
jgi:hypothetical protein